MKNSRVTLFLLSWLLRGTTTYFLQGWAFFLATVVLVRFVAKIIEISRPFLSEREPFLRSGFSLLFLLVLLFSGVAMWIVIRAGKSKPIGKNLFPSQALTFLQNHLPGFLLAGLFFIVYFVLALVFNRQEFNTNNVFFAADTHSWRLRLTHPSGYLFGTRVVHPFPFLILRPVVALCSLLFAGDRYDALMFLLALTGSATIFLAWVFIKSQAGHKTYAYLFAGLLGLSTTSLLFNSLAESYIFSAFFLVSFFVLLQKQRPGLWGLVLNGVALFGITSSNIFQSLLAMFLRGWDLKRTLKYAFFVLSVCFLLSFANRLVYPESALFFFKPSEYVEESEFIVDRTSIEHLSKRFRLMGNEMFLYSMVAPKPYVSRTVREDRGEFPKFNFKFNPELLRFVGFGRYAVWIWVGILVAAVVMFGRLLWTEKYSLPNQLALALLACLGFNFIFHVFYGFEPFLYSANWTYALVLFAAICLRPFAGSKIMHTTLLVLLVLLTFNHVSILYFMMDKLAPYFLASR